MRVGGKRTKPLSIDGLCDWAEKVANIHSTSKARGISQDHGMHNFLALVGCPIKAGALRFFNPKRQAMMVKIQRGEIYVTSDHELISTALGSCISACIWDPFKGIGGMNHFYLPFGNIENIENWDPTQWRSNAACYGNLAMELLINTLLQNGAIKSRLKIKIFGGAMQAGSQIPVGDKNIEFIHSYIINEALNLVGEDLGGDAARKLIFDPKTGKVLIKKMKGYPLEISNQERDDKPRLLNESNKNDNNAEQF